MYQILYEFFIIAKFFIEKHADLSIVTTRSMKCSWDLTNPIRRVSDDIKNPQLLVGGLRIY